MWNFRLTVHWNHHWNISTLVVTFLNILGATEILCSFRLVLEGKTGKEIPGSSRLEFLEKFLANNFVLILLNSWEPNFWEVMESFVLLTYASLAASRNLLQWLIACPNFTLDSEDLFCSCKQKSDFYELWQQHNQLKTMGLSEAWPDIYDEGYIHQFKPETSQKNSLAPAEALSCHGTFLKWSWRPCQSAQE